MARKKRGEKESAPRNEVDEAKAPGPKTARLATYEAKRRFDITPEPRGSSQDPPEDAKKTTRTAQTTRTAGAFVVQKHDARRLHYDFRLEIDGAMASWAVPKGPSYDPAIKRLAVQTEDHPMDYNAFEGRIPEGQYGAGDVLIWDRGTFETVPPGMEQPMMAKGHLHVRLFGEKLVGEWHLVKTKGQGGDDGAGGSGKGQWLFFKAKDRHANPAYDVVAERPESVVSGRQGTRGPRRVGASETGQSARALLTAVGEPMLATAATSIADPAAWLFEVKYDGYRLFACKAGDDVRLYTRKANDWTDRFRPLAQAASGLPARECVIDGEACVVDEQGRPSFQALQRWLAGESGGQARLGFAAFDLLWLDGRDLRAEPLEARRELLEKLLEGQGAPLTFSRAVGGDIVELVKATKAAGLEGLMAKRKGSRYVAGRGTSWLKLRFDRRQECAILGWLPLANTRDTMGALLLGVVEDGKLVYAGRVGTGFDDRLRKQLADRLEPDRVDAPQAERVPRTKDAHWVTPKLVCDCGFVEWTGDGSMRHPRYLGLREDRAPMDCVKDGDREEAKSAPASPPIPGEASHVSHAPSAHSDGGKAGMGGDAGRAGARAGAFRRDGPKLSNPAKVLFPRDAITKQHVWDYYTAIAPVMLPHLHGRPLTMQRYPDGIDGEEWYQQNAPDKSPPFVRLVDAGPRHDHKKRIVCDTLDTLQWLANLAALTLHQWCSHVPPGATSRAAIDHAMALPDYVVLDLDPGDGPWTHLIEVAHHVKALLDALGLQSYPKTSGKRGIHVFVPIAPGPTHDQATGFAEQVARAVVKVLPKIATVERMKDKRGGKLYVDYGQNGEGRTVVAPYTIRARDGAVVSTPVTWDEVTDDLDPTQFTLRTVPDRVKQQGDLFAGVLAGKQRLPG
jgi:bifunctional non-homologous end joining protein LigD